MEGSEFAFHQVGLLLEAARNLETMAPQNPGEVRPHNTTIEEVLRTVDALRIPRYDITPLMEHWRNLGMPLQLHGRFLCGLREGFSIQTSLRTADYHHSGGDNTDPMLQLAKMVNGLLLVRGLPSAMPLIGIVEYHSVSTGVLTFDTNLANCRKWSRNNPKESTKRLDVALEMATMVHEMHQRNVAHFNLRLETVMMRKDGDDRLLYFTGLDYASPMCSNGLRLEMGDMQPHMTNINDEYASPELLGEIENLTIKSDVFQLGIMIYEILVGKKIDKWFRYHSAIGLTAMLRDAPHVRENPSWLETLQACLIPNPGARPDAAVLVNMLEQAKDHLLRTTHRVRPIVTPLPGPIYQCER